MLAEILKFAGVLAAVFALWPEAAQRRFEDGVAAGARRAWRVLSVGVVLLGAGTVLGAPLLVLLPPLMVIAYLCDAAFRLALASSTWGSMAGGGRSAGVAAGLFGLALSLGALWLFTVVLDLLGWRPGPWIGPPAFLPLAWVEAGWAGVLGLGGAGTSRLGALYLGLRDWLAPSLVDLPLGLGVLMGYALALADLWAALLGVVLALGLVALPVALAVLAFDLSVLGVLGLAERVRDAIASKVPRLVVGATILFALGEFTLLLVSLGRFAKWLPPATG
jgi:hypothetical protein